MRKLLFRTLIVFMSFWLVMPVFSNSNEADKSNVPMGHKIEGFTKSDNKLRYNPMIIGPDLYMQMDQIAFFKVISSTYTASNAQSYITYVADDFIVPDQDSWDVKYVRSTISTSYSFDDIEYYDVFFYADNNNKPGDLVASNTFQSDFIYQDRDEAVTVKDVTITLDETVALTSGKYWISIQMGSTTEDVNSYGEPDFFGGLVLQHKAAPIKNMAHIKNPGGSFMPLYDWSSIDKYWEATDGVDYGLYNISFSLMGVEKDYDLALTEIITPLTGAELSESEIVKVKIQNHGLTDVEGSAYTMQYRIDGGAWTDTEAGVSVASGEELTFKFRAEANFSAQSTYSIEFKMNYTDDENQANNTLTEEIENFGVLYPAIADSKVVYETCEGTFTDHGGLGDVYISYSHDTVVFLPASENSRIRLDFYDTNMSGAYGFKFFNGSSTEAPILGDIELVNSGWGIYTQEINTLSIEGTNEEGAITVIVPGFDINSSKNNFLAKVSCVSNVGIDFKVKDITTSKPYTWETETIQLIAEIENRSQTKTSQLVTFFVNDAELGSVSSTTAGFGETGTATIDWTPEMYGTYNIKAIVPADDGLNTSEKEYEINKEIFELGTFVEGFELPIYPPEGWDTKVDGGSNRFFTWYNDRPYWEGKWSVALGSDTIITPKLEIAEDDILKFNYSAGFFGGTCDILYSESKDGPWKVAHTVNYGLPYPIEYEAPLKNAAGNHYLAFMASGGALDYVRGPKYYFEEHNIEIVDFNGPIDPQVNTPVTYDLKVRNMGTEALVENSYKVLLWKEVNGIKTAIDTINGAAIELANYYNYQFEVIFDSLETGELFATVDYSLDQDLSNNTSNVKELYVIKEGVEYLYDGELVGDITGDINNFHTLAGYNANYEEVIYHKDSLNIKGEICGISLYYKNTYVSELPLKIYIGETSQDNLLKEFLSTSVMNMVYNDTLEVRVSNMDFIQLYIPFDKPYLYSGEKNLIMALYRPAGDSRGKSMYLKSTEVNEFVARWHGMQVYEKDVDVSNPDELNTLTGNVYNQVPNTTFYVKTTDMAASLAGTVMNEDSASFEGVTMSLDGFANTLQTDANGYYIFPVMPETTVDVTAVVYSYYDSTQTASFIANDTAIVNFIMTPLELTSITGRVLANDSLKPIENVEVRLFGYEQDITAYTGVDGKFELSNVLNKKEYEIVFGHYKYDTLKFAVESSFPGVELGDIVLDEIEQPAFNLFAKANGDDIEISWRAPYSGRNGQLDIVSGYDKEKFLYNEPDEDAKLGNLFRVDEPGTVTSVELHSYPWQGAQEGKLTIKIYNRERELVVESDPFIMPLEYGWFNVDVPDFSYTDDFYVMVHWNKVHQQTPAINFHTIESNDVAYFVDGRGKWQLVSDLLPAYQGAISIIPNIITNGSKASRGVTSYNLFRSNLANSHNPDSWVKINDEVVSGTESAFSIIDDTYSELGDGFYIYMLETHYTLDTAPILYSNDLDKGLFVEVEVNVTSNNGVDISGAVVELKNTNGTSINTYIASVTDGGIVFPRVRKGDYTVSVSKGSGYEKYTTTEAIQDVTTLDIELIEVIFTPSNLNIEVVEDEQIAKFSWALGENKEFRVDDNGMEQLLSVEPDGDAALGNLFETEESGTLVEVEVFGYRDEKNNPDAEKGEVVVAIYDAETEKLLGKSLPFIINPDGWLSVELSNVPFNGSFYAMVQWSATEPLNTDAIGIDTASNPGAAYFHDTENGFVQMASWGMWGNFGVRAHALVSGKKAAYSSPFVPRNNMVANPGLVNKVVLDESLVSKSRSAIDVSYNIFLNNMDEPILTGLEESSFVFTGAHLTVPGSSTYEAGVQSVYVTGKSVIAKTRFDFTSTVSVLESIDQDLVIYPNPAKSVIHISGVEKAKVEFYNSIGELSQIAQVNGINTGIDVSALSEGVYVVRILVDEGNLYRNILIIE